MTIFPENRIKQALACGGSVVGTMLSEIRQQSIMQLLVNAGFDFVIIDNEHGPFSIESIAELSRNARILGLTPIVRVPDLSYPYLAQPLDAGAQGLMLPRVYDAGQVLEAVQIVKYPPVGKRGCAFSRGATDLKGGPVAETMAKANEETMLIVQIETQEAVEQLDEILSVPCVDVAFVGPTDLSISLGVPGQMGSPVLTAAIEQMVASCQRHGVVPGIQMNDLDMAVQWVDKGMRLISSMSETALLVSAGRHLASTIREAFK